MRPEMEINGSNKIVSLRVCPYYYSSLYLLEPSSNVKNLGDSSQMENILRTNLALIEHIDVQQEPLIESNIFLCIVLLFMVVEWW